MSGYYGYIVGIIYYGVLIWFGYKIVKVFYNSYETIKKAEGKYEIIDKKE